MNKIEEPSQLSEKERMFVRAKGVLARESLGGALPQAADLLRGVSRSTLLPVASAGSVITEKVSHEEGGRHGATAGHRARVLFNASSRSSITVNVGLVIATVEVPRAEHEVLLRGMRAKQEAVIVSLERTEPVTQVGVCEVAVTG